MPKITNVKAREILDSRGHPTIETVISLDSGHQGVASVPSGASSSKYEAVELRDQDPHRFRGLWVLKAIELINTELAPRLKGQDPTRQTRIDQQLIDWDASPNKAHYGANSLLSLSQACVQAAAGFYNLPFYQSLHQKSYPDSNLKKIPTPTFNIINGRAPRARHRDLQGIPPHPSSP